MLFAQGCKVWKWKPNKEAKLFTQLRGNRFKFNDVTTTPDGKVFCTVLGTVKSNMKNMIESR